MKFNENDMKLLGAARKIRDGVDSRLFKVGAVERMLKAKCLEYAPGSAIIVVITDIGRDCFQEQSQTVLYT